MLMHSLFPSGHTCLSVEPMICPSHCSELSKTSDAQKKSSSPFPMKQETVGVRKDIVDVNITVSESTQVRYYTLITSLAMSCVYLPQPRPAPVVSLLEEYAVLLCTLSPAYLVGF